MDFLDSAMKWLPLLAGIGGGVWAWLTAPGAFGPVTGGC